VGPGTEKRGRSDVKAKQYTRHYLLGMDDYAATGLEDPVECKYIDDEKLSVGSLFLGMVGDSRLTRSYSFR
jgi:hypothetical protein